MTFFAGFMLVVLASLGVASASLIDRKVLWRPLPHFNRATAIKTITAATLASGGQLIFPRPASALAPRSAQSIESWAAIPVWPAWPTPTSPTGGRVRPISPNPAAADPFLLLAHHRHSFSPGDPLRGPFRAVGGALGLPYVGEEGFKLHPHRGIDIWTIVLDGSDGFRHRDSLGGTCTYRGGSCQFMRAGKGAMHEEMWETRSDRPTSIELFQLWINLPARLKMAPPAIGYVGSAFENPYREARAVDERGLETVVRTLDYGQTLERGVEGNGGPPLQPRPFASIRYATIPPGGSWAAEAAAEHTAIAYVRSGQVRVNGQVLGEVDAGSTATFAPDGSHTWLVNPSTKEAASVLLLTGEPLREPVALGGPIGARPCRGRRVLSRERAKAPIPAPPPPLSRMWRSQQSLRVRRLDLSSPHSHEHGAGDSAGLC